MYVVTVTLSTLCTHVLSSWKQETEVSLMDSLLNTSLKVFLSTSTLAKWLALWDHPVVGRQLFLTS